MTYNPDGPRERKHIDSKDSSELRYRSALKIFHDMVGDKGWWYKSKAESACGEVNKALKDAGFSEFEAFVAIGSYDRGRDATHYNLGIRSKENLAA
jgi:hypothetical protein